MTNRLKLFGTWKNRLTVRESCDLAAATSRHVRNLPLPFELGVCPPMTALAPVRDVLNDEILMAAQNVVWDDDVSFTGETSAKALVELGASFVIIGHSERRLYLEESDTIVAKKVGTALAHGITPIICIGEFFEDHNTGRSLDVIRSQFQAIYDVVDERMPADIILAYEPAWAISTSKQALKCEPQEANSRHQFIRQLLKDAWSSEVALKTSIIYGGSVSSTNVEGYFQQPDIDGGLVGTASQSAESFRSLIDGAKQVFDRKIS